MCQSGFHGLSLGPHQWRFVSAMYVYDKLGSIPTMLFIISLSKQLPFLWCVVFNSCDCIGRWPSLPPVHCSCVPANLPHIAPSHIRVVLSQTHVYVRPVHCARGVQATCNSSISEVGAGLALHAPLSLLWFPRSSLKHICVYILSL